MGKALKLWNGRLLPYEHGFIAAYSRADAQRVWHEALGQQRGTMIELTQYWHEGAWGNSMIGITPERGMWAQLSDGTIARLNDRKEYPVTLRGPEWDEHLAKEKVKWEQRKTDRERRSQEQALRIKKLARFLVAVGLRVGVKDEAAAIVEWEGHKYKVTEDGPIAERETETTTVG